MAANGQRFPRRKGVATLVARAMVSSQTLRVTLRGEGFGDDWPIQQPGEIVTLLFVPPGEPVVLPDAPAGRSRRARRSRSGATTPSAATGPTRGEIDVDVVLHEPARARVPWAAAGDARQRRRLRRAARGLQAAPRRRLAAAVR